MEADLVQRAGIPYRTIPAGQIAGMGLRMLPNLIKSLPGYAGIPAYPERLSTRCAAVYRRICRRAHGPGRVRAAWRAQNPQPVYVPDIEPGMALKLLARFATHHRPDRGKLAQVFPRQKAHGGYRLPHPPRPAWLDPRKSLPASGFAGRPLYPAGHWRQQRRALDQPRPAGHSAAAAYRYAGDPYQRPARLGRSRSGSKAASCPIWPKTTTPTLPARNGRRAGSRRPGRLSGRRLHPGRISRCSACPPSWCRIRMPGATRKSMPITWSNAEQRA